MANTQISDPLLDVLVETERYVAGAGWEQPPRLFALVATSRLVELEPTLADQLDSQAGSLSSVEQDVLDQGQDDTQLEAFLATLAWPPEVDGVALAVERLVLPPSAAAELSEDPAQLAQAIATHPQRVEVRLFAGVTRQGAATCLLRQRLHDSDEDVAIGHNIAPDLLAALADTLRPETPESLETLEASESAE